MGKKQRSVANSVFKIDDQVINDPTIVANSFNNYYCSIGDRTAESLPASNYNFNQYLPPATFKEFNFDEVRELEVKHIILKCKNTRPGVDEIPMFIFKNNIDIFVPIITYLCNLSLRNCVFPSNHKSGIIIPIHKS